MEIRSLIDALTALYRQILKQQQQASEIASWVHPDYRQSALNLYHYLVLRSSDLRDLHDPLSDLGVSSLRSAEGYVLRNLHDVVRNLNYIAGTPWEEPIPAQSIGYRESKELLWEQTARLFGRPKAQQRTEIMVTLTPAMAANPDLLADLAQSGMSVARINLAKDDEAAWQAMVDAVRQAGEASGRVVRIYMDLGGPKIRTQLPEGSGPVPLENGQRFWLQKAPVTAAQFNAALEDASGTTPLRLNSTLPEILDRLERGDLIYFDDGLVKARVVGREADAVEVEILQTHQGKLKSDKGINIPGRDLELPSLTERDLETLPFVARNADLVGYSFVNKPEDVRRLYQELERLHAPNLGVVFKIETPMAFDNLPQILLEGMKRNRIGVMIARGDLAVELGFDRISEVQNEILWFCEAAHVPVIWATQVLDTLAKTGIATRAEISDVTLGTRSECVMLNKGAHILDAVKILKTILERMQAHTSKKKDALRELNVARKSLERLRKIPAL